MGPDIRFSHVAGIFHSILRRHHCKMEMILNYMLWFVQNDFKLNDFVPPGQR